MHFVKLETNRKLLNWKTFEDEKDCRKVAMRIRFYDLQITKTLKNLVFFFFFEFENYKCHFNCDS